MQRSLESEGIADAHFPRPALADFRGLVDRELKLVIAKARARAASDASPLRKGSPIGTTLRPSP